MGSTATPRLKAGALQRPPRRFLPSGTPPAIWVGGLIPNPLVTTGAGPAVRLDAILAGRTAVLTARRPDAGLVDFCRRHGLVLVRISSTAGTGTPAGPGAGEDADWIDVRLAGDALPAGMRALVADPALTVIVRPDRVIAAVEPRSRLPRLPWYVPASAVAGYPAPAPSPALPEPAGPVSAAR
jgi:3-(3-hydroxy-phenyl)propionate hydroxylase